MNARDGVLYISNTSEDDILVDLPETDNINDLLETVMNETMKQSFYEPEPPDDADLSPDGYREFAEELETVQRDNKWVSDLAVAVYRHEVGGVKDAYKLLQKDWRDAETQEVESDVQTAVEAANCAGIKPKALVNSFLQAMEQEYHLKPEKLSSILKEAAAAKKPKAAER